MRDSVYWITNVAAPYRIPVWRALAEKCDLSVYLLESNSRLIADKASNRGMDWLSRKNQTFMVTFLRTLRFSKGEARYYLLLDIFRLPRSGKPTAILLGGWESPSYWQILFWAKICGIRTVGFYESTLYTQRHTTGLISKSRKLFFQSLDAVVCPGPSAAKALESMGVPSENIAVGFNAVDVEAIHLTAKNTRAQRKIIHQPGHRFIYVGQLIERKGVDLIIRAFQAINLTGSTLTIVGVGNCESSLRALVKSFDLNDRINFLGYVENVDLPIVVAEQNTLVMPSREEVWGLVANEALACGLQVVVSNCAGVAASIEHMQGVFLVNPSVENVSQGMLEASRSWMGYIQSPEILDESPDKFASVFARSLGCDY